MRFSDMMGSGAERAPKSTDTSESDAVADALAPYLSAPAAAERVVAADEAVTAEVVVPREVAVAPDATLPTPPLNAWVPERPAPRLDDVVSDDLLPRRRGR